ncbi:related to toxD gene [Cephalotrichum gorgonifer]|uniref:Related to toxD protein n=1 Tax=Cephalotrichum gorgonifer TaxID=2041049 RepID=A0AAE8N9C4_9PEZI|nr:related to toxD gene [Cephalotrichum gorgonifer]
MAHIPDVPATYTAIIQHEGGELRVTHDVPTPSLLPGWLLVKNVAVALNPCDFKMAARFPTPGLKDGVDFSGTVVAVGEGVKGFSVGDGVFGCVPSNKQDDAESGSFGQYVKVEEIYALHIPPNTSFEQALAFAPACVSTAALALHESLKMPATPDEVAEYQDRRAGDTVLVYGGSSSVGLLAIQLLKLCGYRVATTCSPHNFNLVKKYGADAVFDYRSPTCAADIKAYTRNRLRRVIDPFAEVATTSLCYEAIGRAGGTYCALEQYEESICTRQTVHHQVVMGPAILGRGVLLPEPYGAPADPELHEWSKRFYRNLQELILDGRLKPLPIKVLEPAGFDTVLAGLELLKGKQVSGTKLVVRVAN